MKTDKTFKKKKKNHSKIIILVVKNKQERIHMNYSQIGRGKKIIAKKIKLNHSKFKCAIITSHHNQTDE